MDKDSCRFKIKKDLSLISQSDYQRMSLALSKNLSVLIPELISNIGNKVMTIGGFSPIQNEPLWFRALEEVAELNFSLVHMHKERKLSFYETTLSELKLNNQLKLDKSKRSRECVPEIMLVPGLAFNRQFERLGRGGGYYDSYLANNPSIKIGICFESQLDYEFLCEEHDQKMNYIITDKKIYKRGK